MGLAFVEPQLPTLVDVPPEGKDWIHEVKYDGWRGQIVIDETGVQVFTRRGHDWTDKFTAIAAGAAKLKARNAILDGEIVWLDEHGRSDYAALRKAIKRDPARVVFVAFDLLYLNDRDLRATPLWKRREALWILVKPAEGAIQFSHHIEASGAAFFKAADAAGLEGTVSKDRHGKYWSGRSKSWLKTKCFEEAEFDVIGVLAEPGEAPQALMASRDERKYVGGAFIALNQAMRERLWKRVKAKSGPPPKGIKIDKPKAQWVRPGLIGKVRFLKGEEKLRHATLHELREE